MTSLVSAAVPPKDAGVFNVRDPKYGAKGDGKTDDTAAIQKALSEALDSHRIVYLPNGTYLVSDSLKWWREGYSLEFTSGWGGFLQFEGESQAGTIIKLKDRAPGFTDPQSTRAVIITGSRGYDGHKGYRNGEGNEAFENNLRDFTVDVGVGNAGAVGVDYQASNQGAIRHVTIRSSDPAMAGAVGIDLRRRDNGPGTINDVTIEGFEVGVQTAQDLAQFLLEHLTLKHQRTVGILNENAVLGILDLESQNTVPAFRNTGVGFGTIINAHLVGGSPTTSAIVNQDDDSMLHVCHLQTAGYGTSIENRDNKIATLTAASWTSDDALAIGNSGKAADVAITKTPVYEPPVDASQWAVVQPTDLDDTANIQAALNSGKPVVALAFGSFTFNKTLHVPSTVRAVIGFGARVGFKPHLKDGADFIIEGDNAEPILFDRIEFAAGEGNALVQHQSPRAVVLRDLTFFSGTVYRNVSGSGPVFVDDVVGAGYNLINTTLFARQWNIEGPVNTIRNSHVWAIIWKHEGSATVLDISDNSQIEAYGGLCYTFGGLKIEDRPFAIQDSAATLSFVNITFVGDGTYPRMVDAVLDSASHTIDRGDGLPRGGGRAFPLIVVKH